MVVEAPCHCCWAGRSPDSSIPSPRPKSQCLASSTIRAQRKPNSPEVPGDQKRLGAQGAQKIISNQPIDCWKNSPPPRNAVASPGGIRSSHPRNWLMHVPQLEKRVCLEFVCEEHASRSACRCSPWLPRNATRRAGPCHPGCPTAAAALAAPHSSSAPARCCRRPPVASNTAAAPGPDLSVSVSSLAP